MTTEAWAPSIAQLHAVVEGLAPTVSASRLRQLKWVAGEMGRAVADAVMPEEARSSLAGLLAPDPVAVYLTLAAAGRLRVKDMPRREVSRSSMSVRVSCLRQLGRAAGVEVAVPSVAQPDPRPEIPVQQQAALYRRLVEMAAEGPLVRDGTALSAPDRCRLLAMTAVVLSTGARSGELAGMRLGDLDLGAGTLVVRRRGQKGSREGADRIAGRLGLHRDTVTRVLAGRATEVRISEATQAAVWEAFEEVAGEPRVEVYRLREGAVVAVRRWLRVREGLVAGLEGGRDALWVALQANGVSHQGFPLAAGGVWRAYVRGVTALNWLMAGEHGWEPLPTSLETLRRSVRAEPIEA